RLPGARGAPVERCLGSAGKTKIDETFADHAVGEADGVSGGGASADYAEGRALDAVFDADRGGSRAADGLEQRQRMGGALVLLEQHLVGEFEGGQAADAGADDAGRAIALVVLERQLGLGLSHGFLSGTAGILRVFVR